MKGSLRCIPIKNDLISHDMKHDDEHGMVGRARAWNHWKQYRQLRVRRAL